MRVKLGPNEQCWCGSGKKYKRCHQPHDLLKRFMSSDVEHHEPRPGFRAVRPYPLTPMRQVPEHIVRPDYAASGRPGGQRARATVRTPDQLDRLRRACRAARRALELAKAAVRPGITTDEIDAITHQAYIDLGGYPSTLNYHGFPKSLCTSVNEVICHGIPDDRPLRDGDIVNLDVTIFLEGMHGDLSETVGVGAIDEESARLVRLTHECMMKGISAVRPGGQIRDIGRNIQEHANRNGLSVVKAFVGHGVGEQFHMDPQVPHYFDEDARTEMVPGMTFTIEPMINLGTWKHVTWDDNWTAVTADLRRSAQFEHTVLVTHTAVEILTLPEGEPQPFAG